MERNSLNPHPARWWHTLDDGRLQCDLCPRECRLRDGQHGACLARHAENGQMWLSAWGRTSGFCIDPVEKKPLNHFLPGSRVLSFGTVGCNLACKFCQNWDISKARELDRLQESSSPQRIAAAAVQHGCQSVAYTYNDPIVFAEYAIATAEACHQQGLRNVAVTNGYISPEARRAFYAPMDAANVDLKGFSDHFYQKLCGATLQPVLDTLCYLRHETSVWLEITTLLIPGYNDQPAEIRAMCEWLQRELGEDVPLHFTAFHPDFRVLDTPPTPPETLFQARNIARDCGLRYVYTGNIFDSDGGTTYCPHCYTPLIARNWHTISHYVLTAEGHCPVCQTKIPGRFAAIGPQTSQRPQRIELGD